MASTADRTSSSYLSSANRDGATQPAPARAQVAVAIVVHPETPVDNLSFAELRSIFRGERQFWADGRRVTLLMRAPVADERRLVLERIYEMDEGAFREYWIGKMFRADVASGPKIVRPASSVISIRTR